MYPLNRHFWSICSVPVLGPRVSETPWLDSDVAVLLFVLLWVDAFFVTFCECVNMFVAWRESSALSQEQVGRKQRLLKTAVHFTFVTFMKGL